MPPRRQGRRSRPQRSVEDDGDDGGKRMIETETEEDEDQEEHDAGEERKRRKTTPTMGPEDDGEQVDDEGGDDGNGDGGSAAAADDGGEQEQEEEEEDEDDETEAGVVEEEAAAAGQEEKEAGDEGGKASDPDQAVKGDLEKLKQKTREMLRNGQKASALLRPIFSQDSASFDASPHGESYRESVCLFLMQLIEDPELHATLCSDLLDILMVGVDSLSGDGLVAVCTQILRTVKACASTSQSSNDGGGGSGKQHGTGKVFELLPKALSRLEALDALSGELDTGNAFKSFFLNRLCNMTWPPHCVLPIADAFKTVTFEPEQLKFASNKLVRCLHDVPTEEVPPLVYQLLLLSGKGQRPAILRGILAFCAAHSAQAVHARTTAQRHSVTQAQGTVLMHISFAVKQDQDLGRELLKLIKTDTDVSPFTVAAALCLLTVPRFEQTVQSVFMSLTTKHDVAQQRLCRSVWLTPYCNQSLNPLFTFKTVVNGTANGWDYVTAPLLRLCFYFLDSIKQSAVPSVSDGAAGVLGASEPPVRRSAVSAASHPNAAAPAASSSVSVAGTAVVAEPTFSSVAVSKGKVGDRLRADIASTVVSTAFGMHAPVRPFVIDEMISRIITRSSPNIIGYITLFARLIRTHVHELQDHTEKLRDVLDYLVFLPSTQSTAILQALMPLVTTSERLKEACILVLRKALFNRSMEARVTAVQGFLYLLNRFNDPVLWTEITTSLRRCFSQQLPVRRLLYQRCVAAASATPTAAPAIADLLEHQRLRLLRPGGESDTAPPFATSAVVQDKADVNHQMDTVGGLVNALHVLSRIPELEATHAHLPEFLSQFVTRMIKCDLEDFEIDKAADFSDASSGPAARNVAAAYAVIEAYDACINIVAQQDDLSLERCQHLVTLLRKRQTVFDLLKEGHRKRKDTDRCLISITCLQRLLHFVLVNDNADDEAPKAILTSKVAPMRFFLTASQHVLSLAAKTREASDLVSILLFECSRSVDASPLRKLYDDKKNKGKQLRALCYQQILACLQEHANDSDDAKTAFLAQITQHMTKRAERGEREEGDNEEGAVCSNGSDGRHPPRDPPALVLKWAQGAARACLNDSDLHKSVAPLIDICALTVNSFSNASIELAASMHSFLDDLSRSSTNTDDPAIFKALCQQLLEADNSGKAAHALAMDAQIFVGYMAEEDEDEDLPQTYGIVCKRVCETAVLSTIVTDDCDQRLDDINFALEQLTQMMKAGAQADKDLDASQPDLPNDEPLYERLYRVTTTVVELLRTAFPSKSSWTRIFKTSRHLYDTLSNACRTTLLYFQTRKETRVPKTLENTIHFCAKHLSSQAYVAINFVNSRDIFDDKPKKPRKGVSAVGKIIPNLVYSIELFEKMIIRVEKKAHANLLKHMKRSTARDFRISAQAVHDLIAENESADADEDDSKRQHDDSADSNEAKVAKRE